MSSPVHTIYELYERSMSDSPPRQLAVLIGSGLSAPAPTCLPVSREAIVSLLRLDWFSSDERYPLAEEEINGCDLGNIRFEHLLSILRDSGNYNLGQLLGQFAEAPFNWYHEKIAGLCGQGKIGCIITTNFDSCIENALDRAGIRYNLIVSPDDVFSEEPGTVNLFKIHGTIDADTGEGPERKYVEKGLCATLQSMYRGLDGWKRNILDRILDGHTLVFLGYSGLDSYDISPVLCERGDRYLFWVSHTEGNAPGYVTTEQRAILAKSVFPEPVCTDTAAFLGGNPLQRGPPFRLKASHFADKCYLHPSIFVGKALESVSEYERARDYYERVLADLDGSRYLMVQIMDLHWRLGACYYELRQYEQALAAYTIAEALLLGYNKRMEEDGSTPVELRSSLILNHYIGLCEERALAYARLGKKEEAFEAFKEAFRCLDALYRRDDPAQADDTHYSSLYSRLLLNRASTGLDFLEVRSEEDYPALVIILEDLQTSYRIKQQIGDAIGIITCLTLLGSCHVSLGDWRLATSSYIDVVREFRKLKTPPDRKMLEVALLNLSWLIVYMLSGGDHGATVRFVKRRDPAALEFRSQLESTITRELYREDVIDFLLKDEEVRESYRKLEPL